MPPLKSLNDAVIEELLALEEKPLLVASSSSEAPTTMVPATFVAPLERALFIASSARSESSSQLICPSLRSYGSALPRLKGPSAMP